MTKNHNDKYRPELRRPDLFEKTNFIDATHYDPAYLWQFEPYRVWFLRRMSKSHAGRNPAKMKKTLWDACLRWQAGTPAEFAKLDEFFLKYLNVIIDPETLPKEGWLMRKHKKASKRSAKLLTHEDNLRNYKIQLVYEFYTLKELLRGHKLDENEINKLRQTHLGK